MTITQSQVLQPNLFIFSGDGGKITYSSKKESHFDFEDSEGGKRSYSGKEIRVENSTELGELVTVTLDMTTDAGSTSLTLLIPHIQLTGLALTPQPIKLLLSKHIIVARMQDMMALLKSISFKGQHRVLSCNSK